MICCIVKGLLVPFKEHEKKTLRAILLASPFFNVCFMVFEGLYDCPVGLCLKPLGNCCRTGLKNKELILEQVELTLSSNIIKTVK